MRTDAKIGLAIGSILLLVVVLFVWFGSGGRPEIVELDVSAPSVTDRGEAQRGERAREPLDDAPLAPPRDPFGSANAPMATAEEPATGHSSYFDWDRMLETGVIMNAASEPVNARLTPANTPASVNTATAPGAPPRSSDALLFRPPSEVPPSPRVTSLPESPPAAPAGTRTHTVRSGETFSSIAAAVYGSANYYPHIMRANPDVDERRLRPGMVLRLPDPAEVRPQTSATRTTTATAAPTHVRREYRVQENDSLYRISMRLYGRADRIEEIYQLNREQIGPDQNRLRVGMVLRLPEPPTRPQ